ncbi:MAG: hypothetical protein IPN52_12825 [Micrococcales bacterium]|nr:hypothetical protein [Micrococcales bacterium]
MEIVERALRLRCDLCPAHEPPIIGRIQVQIHLSDFGERDGYRIVAWDQDDEGTEALNKKQGARTAYNLGAWLLTDDAVGYALSTAPLKSDVGTLEVLGRTKRGGTPGQRGPRSPTSRA